MIAEIIDKVILGTQLSSEERTGLLEWFARAESLTGQLPIESDIAAMVDQALTAQASSFFPRLSDISAILGTVVAGEFRSGNFKTPGDGFTGGRFGYPGFTYGSNTYFLAGVENDVLQVGLSLADGSVVAGGGNVIIDQDGIFMQNSSDSWFNFEDANGNRGTINIAADPNNVLEIVNIAESPAGVISFYLKIGANTRRVFYLSGTAIVFNESGDDTDFIVGVSGCPGLFTLDSTNHRVEIKNSSNVAVHIIDPAGITYFNEPGNDLDTIVRGNTDDNLTVWDAGLDAIGMGGAAQSGYKLKVHGNVNLSAGGDYYRNGVSLSDAFDGLSTTYAPYSLTTAWLNVGTTWTRTGNHTFTVSGSVTAIYRKGTKVRYKDGGSFEYGVIASSSHAAGTTTVQLIPNTDYLMAAATITEPGMSYYENPEAFPQWFNFDAAPTGFSAVPSSPVYRWQAVGNTIHIAYSEANNGTSNATTFAASAPVASVQNVTGVAGTLVDNGALLTVAGRVTMTAGSAAITFRTNMSTGAWTNANGKRAVAEWFYEF